MKWVVVSGCYDAKAQYWEEGTIVDEIPEGANPAKFRPVERKRK